MRSHRRAALAVEAALVFPVLLLLLLALIVGGMGVFHYQQVACLAQEAARHASLRGVEYELDTGKVSPSSNEILKEAILPLAVTMQTENLAVEIHWIDKATNTATAWDSATKEVKSITATGEYVNNTVRVTVRYDWSPGVIFGPRTLSSTCEVPMSN